MQSSEFDTLPFQEQAHLVLALHALFPSLSRAMRSKVEMYRSITQRLLLSFDLSHCESEDEYDAFCELLGLLVAFPPFGIEPSLPRDTMVRMIQAVLSKQNELSSMQHAYYSWIALEGMTRYCQQCYYAVSYTSEEGALYIRVVDALNRVDSGIQVRVVMDGKEQDAKLENGEYVLSAVSRSPFLIRVGEWRRF